MPEDATVVLVLEPRSALSATQQSVLLEYIQQGGRVWFASSDAHETLLSPFQIETLQGVVAETKTQSNHWDHPMLSLEPTEVNIPLLSENRSVVFGRTSAFSLTAGKQSGIRQSSFANLRSQAWLETSFTNLMPVFDEETDWKGNASLVAGIEVGSGSGLVEDSVTSSRMLVMGDIDWVSNGMLGDIPSNALFAEALLSWLMDASETSITKYRTPSKVLITKPQLGVLRVLLLLPLPLLIAVVGFFSWRRRR